MQHRLAAGQGDRKEALDPFLKKLLAGGEWPTMRAGITALKSCAMGMVLKSPIACTACR